MLKNTEFLKGISFEEDPYEDETPSEIQCFDLDGNEVICNEAK